MYLSPAIFRWGILLSDNYDYVWGQECPSANHRRGRFNFADLENVEVLIGAVLIYVVSRMSIWRLGFLARSVQLLCV